MFGITRADAILVVGLASLGFLAFVLVREQGAIEEREKQYKAQIEGYQKDVEASKLASKDLEAQLTAMRDINLQLNKELENETAPVYSSCVTPDSGLRILNAARAATGDAPR